MIAEVPESRILRMSFMQVTEAHHKVLRSQNARWPPKGYLQFPLEASHWHFLEGPLHNLLQTEALLEIAMKV